MDGNSLESATGLEYKADLVPTDSGLSNNAVVEVSKHSSVRPKSSRPTGPGSSSRSGQSKAKAVASSHEKRPSGRGSYNANASRNVQHGCTVTEPEVGSVSRPGSKKTNALGDLTVHKRRGGYDNHGRAGFDSGAEFYSHHRNFLPRNRNLSLCYGPSYNKEQYLQATCQFVVMDGFNYAAHLTDADLVVDWDRIEELRLTVDEIPCCPICLYPPNAAKITRCGHVFCWPCILHYLALSDKTWRKCPICYESVYKNQLKSVIASKVPRFNIGEEMTLLLMRREKGSNVVLPAVESPQRRQIEKVDGPNAQFSKLVLTNREQVVDVIIKREREELLAKLVEDEHEPEACFIREALESLQERENLLKTENLPSEKSPVCGSPLAPSPLSPFGRQAAEVFVDAFNDEKRSAGSCSVRSAQSAPAAVTMSSRVSSTMVNASGDDFAEDAEIETAGLELLAAAATAASTLNDKAYYFYQAQDGQQIYLHPVSARCFIHQYGSLAKAPQTITGVMTEMETFVMTEELRRRYRYLSHLPLTTTFKLVEMKFAIAVLSTDTVGQFASDFAKREEARQRKAKEEKRQETQAERWERAVMLDPRNFSKYVSSSASVPEIPVTTYVPSAQKDIEAAFNNGDTDAAEAALDPSPGASGGETLPATLSFAQMLRHGKPKPAAVTAQADPCVANGITNRNSEEEQHEMAQLQSFQDAFGDALQLALDKYQNNTAANSESAVDEGAAMVVGKKKKKKTKGRLLFSIGAAAPGLR